jgi:hypothetical protein
MTPRLHSGYAAVLGRWLRWCLLLWEQPATSTLLAFGAYLALAAKTGPIWQPSSVAYYNYLADALLHGQLHLRLMPAATLDLSSFQGRLYLYWSPFPAILLLPFIAAFGVRFSDIIFTAAVGALNAGAVALLLRQACRRRIVRVSRLRRALLVLSFALGTVHLTLAAHGRVWFTGQVVAFLCVALAYLAAISWRGYAAFGLTGLALAGALLTRNHLLLAGAWPAWLLLCQHWPERWRRLTGYVLVGLAPIVAALVLLGIYNWLRFGSPVETGITYHQMSPAFRRDVEQYGVFNLHYLPINLFYQYAAYPFPLHTTSFHGGSLFLLSPIFFAMPWALLAYRRSWSTWILLGTILLVNVPILLLMGTGWVQFGPRYTLDFTVPLLLLTALGVRRWPVWLLAVLVAIGVVSYLIGTLYFGQYFASPV